MGLILGTGRRSRGMVFLSMLIKYTYKYIGWVLAEIKCEDYLSFRSTENH